MARLREPGLPYVVDVRPLTNTFCSKDRFSIPLCMALNNGLQLPHFTQRKTVNRMFDVEKHYKIGILDMEEEELRYLYGTVKAVSGTLIDFAQDDGPLIILNTASVVFISAVEH